MTEAEALTRLKSMTAWNQDPAITEAELEALLDETRVVDSYGVSPRYADGTDNPSWTGTWALRRAARMGWELKAGFSAERYTFSTDVHSHQRDQLQKHALEMVKLYSKGDNGTIGIAGATVYDPVIGNLNGAA